ncbi:hypothetical protein [Chitinasiproducens palmae]|uniref:Uncharacterized protein n=1 Tax=Chitinasiproducens palmae TaxID=1770053 RepID=A0A1H2PSB8_9BURK|nr:hypothetical protein [Chitinasiproducens palmae]SDV49472.1 hypothetical protein SAMN05216551_108112 [Chitinasiproducens palmae]
MKKTDLEKNKGLKIANRQAFDASRRAASASARGDGRQADKLNPLMRRMLARADSATPGAADEAGNEAGDAAVRPAQTAQTAADAASDVTSNAADAPATGKRAGGDA